LAVSVQDITLDSVLAAVQAGHDDVYKLAEHFVVLHTSHTLRSTIAALVEADRLVVANVGTYPTPTRWAVA
jgi:hypothetical protein